jgi:hypothetical protein
MGTKSKMSETTTADAIYFACDSIRDAADHLHRLSVSAEDMGNQSLGETLYKLSQQLDGAATKVRDTYSAIVHEEFQQAQQSSMNIINACLAMADKAKQQGPV